MKKLFVILVFVLIAVSVVSVFAQSKTSIYVEASDGRIFAPENSRFVLPSYVKPESVTLVFQGNSDEITYVDENGIEQPISSGDTVDLTPFAEEDRNGGTVYRLKTYVDGTSRRLTFCFADTLPSIHVETSIGKEVLASTNGKDTQAHITIVNPDGSYEYADSSDTSEIKVRGNATKAYAKKPFQIKLSEKTDLYGMGKSKTWILLANYDDQSNIRNNVMYKIAELMGMGYCEFKNVDLYLDGQYYGIYLLCEKVNISSERVDIEELEKLNDELNATYSEEAVKVTTGIPNTIIKEYSYIPGIINPSDITGGYLVELDNNYWSSELCYFITENNSHYVVKSPEYASKEQMEYIATLFGEMEEAIMSSDGYNRLGKHYTEYADLESLVYAYIIAEFSRNYDAGSSSMYFYKDADKDGAYSKIVKGPLWDCDNTLGNIHKNGASSTEGYWARNRSIWAGLTKHSDFNEAVTKELTRVYDEIFDMIDVGGFIYQQVEEIGSSIHWERARWNSDNYSKWPLYYDGTHYDRWQSAPVFNFIDGEYSDGLDMDNSTVIGYLCEHIEDRLNWLATEWGCDVKLRERSFVEKIEIKKEMVDLLESYLLSPIASPLAQVKLDIINELLESHKAKIVD